MSEKRSIFSHPPTNPVKATTENKPSPGQLVFSPRDLDVVGTKRRIWKTHPGNAFFYELLSKHLPLVMDQSKPLSIKEVSEKIVDILTKDRGSVFLKPNERKGGWIVMDHGASLTKVQLALKNAEIRARGANNGGGNHLSKKRKKCEKKKVDINQPFPYSKGTSQAIKKSQPTTKSKGTTKSKQTTKSQSATNVQDLPKMDYLPGLPPPVKVYRYIYEAEEDPATPIDSYVKNIIDFMCNQMDPNEAALALDIPRIKECESSEQRIMRLQLRQRYIAAMESGISPVNFSKKLLEIWGGSLRSNKVTVTSLPNGSSIDTKKEYLNVDTKIKEQLKFGTATTNVDRKNQEKKSNKDFSLEKGLPEKSVDNRNPQVKKRKISEHSISESNKDRNTDEKSQLKSENNTFLNDSDKFEECTFEI